MQAKVRREHRVLLKSVAADTEKFFGHEETERVDELVYGRGRFAHDNRAIVRDEMRRDGVDEKVLLLAHVRRRGQRCCEIAIVQVRVFYLLIKKHFLNVDDSLLKNEMKNSARLVT